MTLSVEFCGEWFAADPETGLTIGREGDIAIDDNPYLHRHFLAVTRARELWWLANVGTQISATVADSAGLVQAWLSPGATLPIVFGDTMVLFTAGPTTYEINVHNTETVFVTIDAPKREVGDTTIAPIVLTTSQRALIVALAEPLLKREELSVTSVPSSADAAARLGWAMTKFNRKLDNVCEKLDRHGVKGLRGESGAMAVNRRARLVEYAVTSRLVTRPDLSLLDAPSNAKGASS